MNISAFTALLRHTMDNAGGRSRPLYLMAHAFAHVRTDRHAVYEPIRAKMEKAGTFQAADEVWRQSQHRPELRAELEMLATWLNRMPVTIGASAVTSFSSLNYISNNLSRALEVVLSEMGEARSTTISGVLLQMIDASLTAALAAIPVAGPFLAPLHRSMCAGLLSWARTAASAAGRPPEEVAEWTAAADGAVRSAIDVANGGLNRLTASDPSLANVYRQVSEANGLGSLIYQALAIAIQKNNDAVLSMPDCGKTTFASLLQPVGEAQCLHASDQVAPAKEMLPPAFRAERGRSTKYLNQDQTLDSFRAAAAEIFRAYFQFLENLINSSVLHAFNGPISRMSMPASPNMKAALLLYGYYQHKESRRCLRISAARARATAASAQPERDALSAVDPAALEQRHRVLNRSIPDHAQNIDMLEAPVAPENRQSRFKYINENALSTSQRSALDLAKSATKTLHFEGAPVAGLIRANAKNYCLALKQAIIADVAQTIQRQACNFPTTEDFIVMWRLYLGAHLIVNHALCDGKLKTQGKLVKFMRAITPCSAATQIPAPYVDLIRKAGFIHDYVGVLGLTSEARKRKFAGLGKIRWSVSPSNTERALLITFCALVATGLDIGKLSFGFHSWEGVKKELAQACNTISESALKGMRIGGE